MADRILQKYLYKDYYALLHDSEFLLLLSRYGWVKPAVIPRAYYLIHHNELIRKYYTIGSVPLIKDLQFDRILCKAGFYGSACTTSSTTTTTTTASPIVEFLLGNNVGTICSQPSNTLFYSGVFGPGTTMFTDSNLTNRVTGFTFIADNNVGSPTAGNAYNINSSTGVVGSFTGTICPL